VKFLYDEVINAANAYGAKVAFTSATESITFEGFRDRVVAISGGLQQIGVKRGDRISILADNSIDYLAYHYAATIAGAFLHVINVRLALGEIAWAIDDAESHVLIMDENYTNHVGPIREACASSNRKIVSCGDVVNADISTAELIAMDATPDAVQHGLNDPVVLIYTSGTTGRPKGALQTHAGSLHADRCAMDAIGFSEMDRFLAMMPFFHQAGLIRPRANLMAGGETIVLGRMTPSEVSDALRQHEVSVTMIASGLQIAAIAEAAAESPNDFKALRLLIAGGGLGTDRMGKMQQVCALLDCDYMGVYGQTEATGPVTASRGPECFDRPDSCGTALPGFEIAVWNEDGSVLAPHERGEVMVRGVATASYWRNDAANTALYTDSWLHTGDLGYSDKDGFLYLAGRIKELIKTGAENVYPREVEEVLSQHQSINDVVVFGMPDEAWGEAVAAAVILEAGTHLDLGELKSFCRGKIGGYKTPKYLYIVEEIPRNETGKPLKHVLRERLSI